MNEEQENDLHANDNKGNDNSLAKDAGKKALDKFKKDAGKKAAVKGKLAAVAGPVIFWTAVVILAIIIIVGIIMFFETMPGMVMEKIKAIGKQLMNNIANYWGADSAKQIDPKDIYTALNYLDDMGYDLKGYGFLTEYYTDNNVDDKIKDDYGISDVPEHFLDDGLIRKKEDNSVLLAKSDFIVAYMISDNYIYTLRNENLVTDSFWSALGKRIKYWVGFPLDKKFTKGMIGIHLEDQLGVAKTALYNYGGLNTDDVKINPSTKKLIIKKGNGLFGKAVTMEYDIDGWTGRYGMPIDFLTSVHLATMMPDLAYDMQDHFDTEVKIVLHTYEVNYTYYYKTSDGNYVGEDKVREVWQYLVDTNSTLAANPEAFSSLESEIVEKLTNLGLQNRISGLENDQLKIAELSKIQSELLEIMNKLAYYQNNKSSETYYLPYISKVENHWYRDVYYAVKKNSSSENIVRYDPDYEKIYNERWTLYETDDDGKFKLYALNNDGDYAKSTDEIKNYDPELFVQEGEYYIFKGSKEEQKKALQGEGTRFNVTKKAKVLDLSKEDNVKDIGWNDNGKDYWTAYKLEGSSASSGYKEVPDTDGTIYYTTQAASDSKSSIKQTGEGQRAETNSDIKKMFLTNTYFRYDGTTERAEAITKLRKDNSIEYGALSEDDLSKEVTINDTTFKAKDLSGQVVINQDSLNAFSMLENTHTLDADYIYRDFKELVVELGYFTKQELTDETPKLLEFLTPEVDSVNYPNRKIDKRENEYGTMEHSEGDIKALEEIYKDDGSTSNDGSTATASNSRASSTLGSSSEGIQNEFEGDTYVPKIGEEFALDDIRMKLNEDGTIDIIDELDAGHTFWYMGTNYVVDDTGKCAKPIVENDNSNAKSNASANLGSSLSKANKLLGANSSSLTIEITVTVDEFLELADQVHQVMENDQWSYCNGSSTHSDGTKYHSSHHVYSTQAASIAGNKTVDCSSYVCWVLQAAGVVPEGWSTNANGIVNTEAFKPYLIPREQVTEVLAGDILLMPGDGTAGSSHTQINGEDNTQYNCGSTNAIRKRPYKDTSFITNPVGSHGYTYVLRLFENVEKKNPKEYKGYKGNDAVVSPVTGILLEYGTYDGTKIDSVTNEAYRVNVDLKYGPHKEHKSNVKQIISDNVGYAKILVLNQEYYQKLEAKMLSQATNVKSAISSEYSDGTLLNENGTYRDLEKIFNNKIEEKDITESIKDWNGADKTLYGYKEFAESYERGGIAGYIIYIDGFLPELPDASFSQKEIKEKMPYEDESKRTKNTFTTEEVSGDNGISFRKAKISSLDDKDSKLEDKYVADNKYKLSTKSETNKSKAEIKIKEAASPSVYFQCESVDKTTGATYTEDVIVLKEGTIIGRTMTDLELMTESRNIRKEKMKYLPSSAGDDADESQYKDATFEIARKQKTDEGGEPLVIGNYLRIIMRDTDGTPVEDVEDYMKLDKLYIQPSSLEKLMTWQAFEPEGFHYFIDGEPHNEYQKGHLCIRKNSSDKYGYDWVICDGGNSDPNLCPGIFMGWPGKSPNFGGKKTMEVTGYSYSEITDGNYDTWVTGEQLFEIYTAELEHEIEKIKKQIKKFGGDGDAVMETLNQDQKNALIDVVYKGEGYMNGTVALGKAPNASHKCNATLLKKLAAGKKDQVDLYDFYDTNPNHPRRRVANYYMYKEGIYLAHVNNCSYEERFTEDKMLNWKTRYEFLSETPFQDLMRGIAPTEETEDDVPTYTMDELTKPTNPIN